jgi:hypothetical protein
MKNETAAHGKHITECSICQCGVVFISATEINLAFAETHFHFRKNRIFSKEKQAAKNFEKPKRGPPVI